MKLPLVLVVVLLAGPFVAAQDTLDEKFQLLKDAVSANDSTQVKKLALEAFHLISAALAEKAPEVTSEKEAWTDHVEHVKGVQTYVEYAMVTTALASPPETLVDLIGALEGQYPKSHYLDGAYGRYLLALRQTGAAAKTTPIAEKAIANFPQNEDLLLFLMDGAVTRKQPDRALGYANRLTAVMVKHAKPEDLTVAQWERKRTATLGRGYYIAGVIYAQKGQYKLADQNLRPALPLIKGDDAMTAETLFQLGVANYNLGKMTLDKARVMEAAKFSEQCAALNSPFADQARHNALVMKQEGDRIGMAARR